MKTETKKDDFDFLTRQLLQLIPYFIEILLPTQQLQHFKDRSVSEQAMLARFCMCGQESEKCWYMLWHRCS